MRSECVNPGNVTSKRRRGWQGRHHTSGSKHPCPALVIASIWLSCCFFFLQHLGGKIAIPKVCVLKCSLEGDFLYIKTQDRRKEALYPQGRSPWAGAYIPSLPWHQWTSHKSVFIHPPPVLCELLARVTLSIGHAPEHESHKTLQGKKDSCHRLHMGNSRLEMSKAQARNLFHFYLTQHFLG